MNNRDYAPRGRDPSYQDSYNQGGQGNYNSKERRDSFQGDQENYMHPEQKGLRRDQRNMVPSQGGTVGVLGRDWVLDMDKILGKDQIMN